MVMISVIMSVYNDAKYLEKSIQSILSQTFEDFEFIICNDCSTDSSLSIIQKFQKLDSRIKVINNSTNLGLAASLNECIQMASGQYIARMDSDDISYINRLEVEYNFLLEHKEYAVVGSKSITINENDEPCKEFMIHPFEVCLSDAIKKTQIIHPTVLMKKDALLAVNGYTVNQLTQRAEDYDLWCKLLSNKFKIYNLDIPLLYYRESFFSIKKRKYKYRLQEAKLKFYWMKKENVSIRYYLYALKPLIVGLIPMRIMNIYKRKI